MTDVVILVDYYIPGNNAGGCPRSVTNLVDHLSDDFTFIVVSRDHDLGVPHPYENIASNKKTIFNDYSIYYLSSIGYSWHQLKGLLTHLSGKILYLNSYFSYHFSIKPLLLRKFGFIRAASVVLAPRGEFSTGALSINSLKKRMFIFLSKIAGLHKGIIWHASTELEEADIRRVIGDNVIVKIAPDLPEKCSNTPKVIKRIKHKDEARIIFLSRISRKKNLYGALELLFGVNGRILFDIYGPIEDKPYWEECRKLLDLLPSNVTVHYRANVPFDKVFEVFSNYHLFLFPTLGENYGHVILESLVAGCPILISDNTPWKNIVGRGAGWDFPLKQTESYKDIINKVVAMKQPEFDSLSMKAHEFGVHHLINEENINTNRNLFQWLMTQ